MRVRVGVCVMSRTHDRACLAVTNEGVVLLNLARFDVRKSIQDVMRLAVSQRGAIFIGVALSPVETRRLFDELAMLIPNATGPFIGRKQRGTYRHQ